MRARLLHIPTLLVVVVATSACGANPSVEECEVATDESIPGPTVLSPAGGALDIVAESLRLSLTEPDAERLGTEVEIWRSARGERLLRSWAASLPIGFDLTNIAVEDGLYEGVAEATGLVAGQEYAVRARHLIAGPECDSSDCCGTLTAWSSEPSFFVEDGSSTLFDDQQILDVQIELDQASFDAINAEARPPGCVPFNRSYHPGNAIVDGFRFDAAGVRSKGGCGSARDLSQKSAFKINLSWDDPNVAGCPDTRRVHGRKRLTLNNMVQDRSFTRERLAYHYYKLMGVPTPRVAHVRVGVNGDHWGLYLNVETIDRRMLKRWFTSKAGMLYEGTYFCDLRPENVPPNLEDDFCIQAKFSADACDGSPDPEADPLDYSAVRQLAAQIEALPDGGFYPAIADYIDWDRFLSLWAADAVLGHWDGYSYDIVNNYRVYHDPLSDRWMIIPTGVDQTFDRDVSVFSPNGLLAARCLSEPSCESGFLARLSEAADIFEQAGLQELSVDIEGQIASEVAADPRKEGGQNAFANELIDLRSFIARRPDEIRAVIQAR